MADLISIDSGGRSVQLHSMNHRRRSLSLSGQASLLIALGGYNGSLLKVCEKYTVYLNKWKEFPPLNTGRAWSGSILLQSMRAFCFCGTQGPFNLLNSVESLQASK